MANTSKWKSLWDLKIHDRLKLFLWRILANVIPSRSFLASRIGLPDSSCPVCDAELEDLFHIFKKCQPVKILAFASQWGMYIH